MRKLVLAAAALGLTALSIAVPTTAAQAGESDIAGAGCDSKWGPRNGIMYAWQDLDCQGPLLVTASGNSANWGEAANDRATSVMNRGYTGGRDVVKFYEHANYGGGHGCLKPGELYADNLTDNRLSNGVGANDTISSHQWVTSSDCTTFLY
ncbi:peptidase inhibitor family I36 protein [Streptomyces sp. CSDS2]|uniref:peptidase inhibitor family I36 protein n=1 Tax=Streptomyces sp. CSDS2 TaxID=3055051 RepID=UPI0025B1EA43|nr:peptidase inhibitor family I36 protein [Streptomyces sp. CSDS2]MDN3265788.1 peptidase inhibitor family I36 protein [Streptomyces sp. CSDS2]